MSKQNSSYDPWNISHLLQSAYDRWKQKFISYCFAYILIGFIWLGIQIGIFLIGGMISLIGLIFLKSSLFPLFIFAFGITISFLVTFYLLALLVLTNVILFTEKNTGVIQAIKSAKKLVWGYIWTGMISGIFLIGLFPFGFITFFIIPLLWSFWSSFTTFVYLEQRKKGLRNVWISKSLYNQKFGLLLVRSLIPFCMGLLISIPHFVAGVFIPSQSTMYTLLYIFSFVLNFLYMSYVICYNYELYKNLDRQTSVKTPKLWIGLSVAGWIIIIFVVFTFSSLFMQILPIITHKYSVGLSGYPAKNQEPTRDPNITYYPALLSQPVQTPDRIFTLISLQHNFPVSRSDNLSHSQQFLLANVSIENTSPVSIDYSPYDFFLQNSFDELQGPVFAFKLTDAYMLGSGKLAPGAKKTGTVVFAVRKSDIPFTLVYKPFTSPQKFVVEVKI